MKAAVAILERNKSTGVKTVRYYNLSYDQWKQLTALMTVNGKDKTFDLIRAECRAHAIDIDPMARKMGVTINQPNCSAILLALESKLGIPIDNDHN